MLHTFAEDLSASPKGRDGTWVQAGRPTMTEGSGATRDEHGVVTYTMNDPPTRNAWHRYCRTSTTPCALASNASVRVIVMTGAAGILVWRGPR
jgi:hypothetical protein